MVLSEDHLMMYPHFYISFCITMLEELFYRHLVSKPVQAYFYFRFYGLTCFIIFKTGEEKFPPFITCCL